MAYVVPPEDMEDFVSFNSTHLYPCSVMCSNELILSTKNCKYVDFKDKMTQGLLLHRGLGLALWPNSGNTYCLTIGNALLNNTSLLKLSNN